MPRYARLLTGIAAALLAGWIFHGPLGSGEAFVAGLEARAQAVVREAEIPGVEVRLQRDPLARRALLSGSANDFQRAGTGYFPGLNDRILGLAGMGAVRWADGDARGWALPLLVETEALVLVFFGLGLLIGWRLFRPRRPGYL